MPLLRTIVWPLLMLVAVACHPGEGRPADAGELDAGELDAGEHDASEPDSGEADSGVIDAGEPDAGLVDAGLPTADGGTDFTTSSATASSMLSDFPVASVYDHSAASSWSSNIYGDANHTETISFGWLEGLRATNYVKLIPRYGGGTLALCFPTAFTVWFSNAGTWTLVASYTGFPTPSRGDPIILPLPGPRTADGIRVIATGLGNDKLGNSAFQLAEVAAGFDARFEQFTWLNNNAPALPSKNQVQNVGSGPFDPAKLKHWDYDDRGVVIAPNSGNNRNIYAPQAVHGTGNSWTIFFGGWDGSATGNDEVSRTTTADGFGSFAAHSVVIPHGPYIHCNNDSVIQLGPTSWAMVYTSFPNGSLNKPIYATSPDGSTWTSVSLLSMTGYSNWAQADVNGGNAIYKDPAGMWHLYFDDFSPTSTGGVHYATSTDGIHYTYVGQALSDGVVPQDLKAFSHGGTTYYVGAYHANGQHLWTTVSTSLSALGPMSSAFTNQGAADNYIVAAGLVQDGTRIHGILYGAGAAPSLTENRIFAAWLQKKVVFSNSHVRWGDVETGFGPDTVRVVLAGADDVETGVFTVYDTDGTTLLYTSPEVTMRVGDVWQYSGP